MFTGVAVLALIFSSSLLSIYSKKVLNAGLSPVLLLVLSAIAGGIFFLPSVIIRPVGLTYVLFLLLLAALLRFLATVNLNVSIKLAEVSFISPFASFSSVFGIVFGIIFLEDHPSIYGLLGVALIIVGSLLLYKGERVNNLKAVTLRLIGVMLIALSAILLRRVLQETDFIVSTAYLWVFLGALSTPVLLFTKKKDPGQRQAITRTQPVLIIVFILAITVSLLEIFLFSVMQVGYVFAFLQAGLLVKMFLAGRMLYEKGFVRRFFPAVLVISGAILIFYLG